MKANPGKVVVELATPDQVAAILGITRRTVYTLVKEGKLQAHRIARKDGRQIEESRQKLYFTEVDIQEYIQWKYGEEENEDD